MMKRFTGGTLKVVLKGTGEEPVGPLGASPEEIAEATVWLYSDGARPSSSGTPWSSMGGRRCSDVHWAGGRPESRENET